MTQKQWKAQQVFNSLVSKEMKDERDNEILHLSERVGSKRKIAEFLFHNDDIEDVDISDKDNVDDKENLANDVDVKRVRLDNKKEREKISRKVVMPQRPRLEIGGSSLDQALSKMLNVLSSPTPSPVVSDERIRDQIRLLELQNEAARLERDKERQVGVRYRGELHEVRGSDDKRKGSSKKYDRNDRYDEEWQEVRGSDIRKNDTQDQNDSDDKCNLSYNTRNDNMIK